MFTSMQMLLVLFWTVKLSDEFRHFRVIGGRDVPEGELFFVVRIEIHNLPLNVKPINAHCSGTALTPTWTLTAGHCVESMEQATTLFDPKFIVRYDSMTRSTLSNIMSDVVSFIKHPAYKDINPRNDIGLIQTRSVNIPQYAKISALDYSSLMGQELIMAGYGYTNSSDGGLHVATKLQVLNVVAVSCGTKERPCVCIARQCGAFRTLCPGDSGGPALHASGVVALVSSGEAHDCRHKPDRYRSHKVAELTPVSPYIDWISSFVNSPHGHSDTGISIVY